MLRAARSTLRPLRFAVALAVVSAAAACGRRADEAARAEAAAPAPPSAQPGGAADRDDGAPPLYRDERAAMGTVFAVTVAGESAARAAPAVAQALAEIARLEGLLSEWLPGSDIGRVNAGAGGGEAVVVSPEVAAVVAAGLEVSRRSDGAFDLTWAALHGLYRFPPNPVRVPSDAELAAKLPLVGYRHVAFDPVARTLRLERAGMALGTGGIAKGYALDRAAEILEEAGHTSFMLFGGGQVQVRGRKGDRPWRVGIQHPRDPASYFAFLESDGGSISTSGDYEHFVVDGDGRRWHHILDLRTGRPAEGMASVTMLAPTGIEADALSTACFVLGVEKCLAMLAAHPSRPEAVLVDASLRLHTTPGTRERLTFTTPLAPGDRLPR